jgi:hypothetical protein
MDKTTTRIADLPDNITIQNIEIGSEKPYQLPMNYPSLSVLPTHQPYASPPPVIPSQMQMQQQMQYEEQQQQQQQNLQQQMQQHYEQQQQQMQQHYEEQNQQLQINYEQQMQQQNQQLQQLQEQLQQLEQQKLPSRDIPMNSGDYTHDEEIKPNFIPRTNITEDFVRDKEMLNEKKLAEHEQKKKESNWLDTFINDLQTPIFIILLFFVSQLPIINTLLLKHLSILSITNEDGNLNTKGLVIKSGLFGLIFYVLTKITSFIVNI